MNIRRCFVAPAGALAACLLLGAAGPKPGLAQAPAAPPAGAEAAAATPAAPKLQYVVPDSLVPAPPRRTLLAIGEIVGLNTLIWSYDRYLRDGGDNPGFRMGFNSWQENLRNGFEWDDNNFATNNFAHPYHGSMYYNAARSNGYEFWGSIPFAFAGSFMWEHFYETHHPSYNDFVNTSLGGISLGEMMWRLSDLTLDNTARGSSRTWHEIGSMLVNPVRGLTRIFTGEWSRVGPNPEGIRPSGFNLAFDAGARATGTDDPTQTDSTRVFLAVEGQYGDPFRGDRRKPFDTFRMNAQVNFSDAKGLGAIGAHGLLGATELGKGGNAQHLLGCFMHFDYVNNWAYETGQQAVGAAVLSRFTQTPLGQIDTEVHLNAIIMAGVQADYENFTGREYDYGPGSSAVVQAALVRQRRPWLAASYAHYWVHTLNGTAGDHQLSLTRVRLDVPVSAGMGLGAQYLLYLADNDYDDFPDTYRRIPELRGYLTLPLD